MKRLPAPFLPALLSILILSSCTLPFTSPVPSVSTPDTQSLVNTALAATVAIQTQVAFSVQQTIAAGQQSGLLPADIPQPPPPQPQSTNTPDKITVTVSIDTNCRTGPGTVYPIIGALAIGQTAEVVGRSHNSDNWIIKLPSNPAVTCWVWAQYSTIAGDPSTLPVIQPPPTPTPSTINITIYNNCASTIFYAYISLSTDSNWGSDILGSSTISTGGTYTWVYNPGTYDVKVEDSVHNVIQTWFGLAMTVDQYLTACP